MGPCSKTRISNILASSKMKACNVPNRKPFLSVGVFSTNSVSEVCMVDVDEFSKSKSSGISDLAIEECSICFSYNKWDLTFIITSRNVSHTYVA